MLRIKISAWRKRKIKKGLKNHQLLIFFLASFLLSGLTSGLLARTDKTVSISLNLEEWLILEVISDNFQAKDTSHGQAQVELIINPGQPILVRALLAMSHGKKAVLNGILSSPENLEPQFGLKLKWQGKGDLSGAGLINLNESTALAIWQDQGLKSGTIIFENIYEGSPFPLKGIFTLISY